MRNCLVLLRDQLHGARRSISAGVSKSIARSWHRSYAAHFQIQTWLQRHGVLTVAVILFALIGLSALRINWLQGYLETIFETNDSLDPLRSLFLTLGGALFGAAAIVSSLVLFAIQVNIERMPHGLFRRLSTDRKLLLTFAATFVCAAVISTLSLFQDQSQVGAAIFAAIWGTVVVLTLFLFGYRRALILVNPLRQLKFVVRSAQRDLDMWGKRAERAAPLIQGADSQVVGDGGAGEGQYDLKRFTYFSLNSGWTSGAKQGVRYAVSINRNYAETGDHEVSLIAMNVIVAINSAYVKTKGKTFYSSSPLLQDSFSTDSFINDTLEQLRQTARMAVTRGDETQVEQVFKTMADLVEVYATIDYLSPFASKTHAHLAAGYLTSEVERIVPHNMPDVLMEGVRLMGRCARMILTAEGPEAITTLVQKIGAVSLVGVAREEYQPVTLTGVEQLSQLSYNLLFVKAGNIGFAAKKIRENMNLIAKLFTSKPGYFISNSVYLGPYYSATNTQSLLGRLVQLVNDITDAQHDNKDAKTVLKNLREWSDGIYQQDKELLLHTIDKKSGFTFDIIHWIAKLTELLTAASNAQACDELTRDELRTHATWLISVFSFVPSDENTVTYMENYSLSEILFKAAADAQDHGCSDLSEVIAKMLLDRALDAGQYHSGCSGFERAVYGAATLAIRTGDASEVTQLKLSIQGRIIAGKLPDPIIRNRVAKSIRMRASTLGSEGHWGSEIELAMAQVDHSNLQLLLEEIADLIAP